MRVKRREGDLSQGGQAVQAVFTQGTACSDLPGTQAVPLFCLIAWAQHLADLIIREEEKTDRTWLLSTKLSRAMCKLLHP